MCARLVIYAQMVVNKQNALYSVGILTRSFADVSSPAFMSVLPCVVRCVVASVAAPHLRMSAFLCLASLWYAFAAKAGAARARALNHITCPRTARA